MAKRRKKRGRPRTGQDPVIGLRVPAAMLRKIDKLADALSENRTNTLRWLLAAGIEGNAHFLRRGRGRSYGAGGGGRGTFIVHTN